MDVDCDLWPLSDASLDLLRHVFAYEIPYERQLFEEVIEHPQFVISEGFLPLVARERIEPITIPPLTRPILEILAHASLRLQLLRISSDAIKLSEPYIFFAAGFGLTPTFACVHWDSFERQAAIKSSFRLKIVLINFRRKL